VGAALVSALALPARARAQGFRSTPSGGRSTLMGTTGVAQGNDGTAPFFNPATAVNVSATIGLSFNVFSGEYVQLDPSRSVDPVFGVPPAPSTDKFYFEGVPTTLCVFLEPKRFGGPRPGRAGTQKLAGCFGTIAREKLEFVGLASIRGTPRQTAQAQSFTHEASRFVFMGTYAVRVFDAFALGASIQGLSSSTRYVAGSGTSTYGGSGQDVITSYSSGTQAGSVEIAAALGATLEIAPITIGLALQTADLHVYGDARSSGFAQYTGAQLGAFSQVQTLTGAYQAAMPWRLSLGVGGDWKKWSAEVDVSLGFPRDDAFRANFSRGEQVTTAVGGTVAREPLTKIVTDSLDWNFSAGLGLEYFTSEKLSFLGGANFTVDPKTSQSPLLFPIRESRIGGAFGIGTYGPAGSLLFGVQASYGWGETTIPNPYLLPPAGASASVENLRVLFILAGNTSLSGIKQAVENVVAPITQGPQGPAKPAEPAKK
jgi:hypothetical protein